MPLDQLPPSSFAQLSEHVVRDILANSMALAFSGGVLFKAEVDPAIDARVGDIVGDRVENLRSARSFVLER
jgi:hypothetical protein